MTRIGLISDVHMRNGERDAIRAELERVVERFETGFDPHHAFVLGDLVQDGETAAEDARNVEAVRDVLDPASFPTTYLLGNHDVENLSRTDLSRVLDVERFWGHTDVDGQDVVHLDSSTPRLSGPRGELGDRQLEFLRNTLPTLDDALVLVHHPVGYLDLTGNHWFEEFPERALLGDRKELLRIAERTGAVRATFSGHVHETRFTRFWDVDHVVVNAFSKELPDVPLTGTYAEVVVDDDVLVDVRVGDEVVASFTSE